MRSFLVRVSSSKEDKVESIVVKAYDRETAKNYAIRSNHWSDQAEIVSDISNVVS